MQDEMPKVRPRPQATRGEIEAVALQLREVEAILGKAMEALATIRFGLALAGYPVSIKECVNHPAFREEIEARRKSEMNTELNAQLQDLKAKCAQHVSQASVKPSPNLRYLIDNKLGW